ncbi:MAG: P-loop NTPase, partial [Myxococcales bacterium]|nr:P-loop NTPase [Myxococcales bacterium]
MTTRVWAFGGGKGGVGKSLVCAVVGAELARRGLRVVALDADLGAANLHTLLGVLQPARTLDDFVRDPEARLEDVCLETEVADLRLVSGAAAILRAAHPRPAERARLIDALMALDVDAVLLDLGAGTHYATLDLFNLAGTGLVVTGPEPTSIQNAYAFLKAALFRRIELGAGHLASVREGLARV